jgi:hypothetical protein
MRFRADTRVTGLMTQVSFLMVAVLTVVFSTSAAFAQSECSTDNKTGLLSCSSNSLALCRTQFPSCKEPAQAISVQDVLTATSNRCCAITGSRKVQRQRACIGAVQNRYQRAQIGTDGTLKPFLREARRQLQILRRAGCTTGSN